MLDTSVSREEIARAYVQPRKPAYREVLQRCYDEAGGSVGEAVELLQAVMETDADLRREVAHDAITQFIKDGAARPQFERGDQQRSDARSRVTSLTRARDQ